MQGANLVQVLARTLNPSTTNASYETLSHMKTANGFTIELLVISDNASVDVNIRQSALIYLKNTIQDDNNSKDPFIPRQDIDTIKASILEALIRNVTNRKLTPTYREIIFQLAEKYYPREWPLIVDDCLKVIQASTDIGGLLGAVETLKAIFSVFGASIMKQIELNNLSNKTIITLLGLASKLFQNFNQQTSYVLINIFKLFNTAIMFTMPDIMMLNIHNFMIFVKKILDLSTDLSSNENANLYQLKRISLRILYRIYQKHANFRMTQCREFAQKFHGNYTKPFVETLILQVMINDQGDKVARHRSMELAKLSLSCLAYINRQNQEASLILLQHRDSILRLCFDKFRSNLNRNYTNFTDFKMFMHENRVNFQQFVISMINCDTIKEQQSNSVNSILALLLDYLEKGDNQHRELALYLFTEIANEIKYLADKLDEKMIMLVLNYVKPLLADTNHIMVRARSCQLISYYSYLDLPQDHISDIASLVYNCMLVGNSQKQTFLKIYACNAFNSLMKYQKIEEFIKPFIADILKIYTDLMQADSSIIKNFSDLIDLLEEQIAPYANDLIKMFLNMFVGYTQHQGPQNQQYSGEQEEQDKDDDGSNEDEEDTNFQKCARACISSIRQILQASSTRIDAGVSQQLYQLVLWVFTDQNQDYLEEGFNVLNLLLYKLDHQADQQYFLFFKVIVYAILGLSRDEINNIRRKGDNFSIQYANILENVCVDTDKDIIENSIGCLRNFISKSSGDFLRNQRDEYNMSFMDYLFKIVLTVHQDINSTQTDRLIILTIFITMIEHEAVNANELSQILSTVQKWMSMQEQNANNIMMKNQQGGVGNFGNQVMKPKLIYTPVYLQIILLSINFYKVALENINLSFVVQKILVNQECFKCDSELSRVIIGFSHILENQLIGEEPLVRGMLEILPEFVKRLCVIRANGDSPQNDFDMDDQAVEDKVFGEDENTHVIGWQGPQPTNKDMMLNNDEESDDDSDWQQEFNKFYLSPLDKVQEIKYLEDVMKRMAHIYGAYMSQEKQEQLSLYFANAPLKLSQS